MGKIKIYLKPEILLIFRMNSLFLLLAFSMAISAHAYSNGWAFSSVGNKMVYDFTAQGTTGVIYMEAMQSMPGNAMKVNVTSDIGAAKNTQFSVFAQAGGFYVASTMGGVNYNPPIKMWPAAPSVGASWSYTISGIQTNAKIVSANAPITAFGKTYSLGGDVQFEHIRYDDVRGSKCGHGAADIALFHHNVV